MSKVLVILGVTSIGLGLSSLHLVNRLRNSDAIIAELKTEIGTLQAGQQRAVAMGTFGSASAERVITDIVNPPPSAVPPSKDVPKTAAVQGGAILWGPGTPTRLSQEEGVRLMREHRERQRQLMQDPEYREAMRLQSRTNLARQYPGLIEELGLDRTEAEAFFALLADQQMRATEQMEPLWAGESLDDRDPATIEQRNYKIQQAAADMQRNNESELVARFGQQKLQAWKEYQSTIGQRWQLEQMRSTLAAQGLPLNENSSKPMLKAMAEAQQQEIQEYAVASQGVTASTVQSSAGFAFDSRNMEQMIEQTSKRNQRMLDAISSYLTPGQRQALEKDQEAQIKMQEAQLRIMRAGGNINQSGTVYAEGSGLSAVRPLQ